MPLAAEDGTDQAEEGVTLCISSDFDCRFRRHTAEQHRRYSARSAGPGCPPKPADAQEASIILVSRRHAVHYVFWICLQIILFLILKKIESQVAASSLLQSVALWTVKSSWKTSQIRPVTSVVDPSTERSLCIDRRELWTLCSARSRLMLSSGTCLTEMLGFQPPS